MLALADDGYEDRFGDDPFAVPEPRRDPVRRLRGRLAAPVTVWTAWGVGQRPLGLTVSSVMVAEGESGLLMGLLGPLADLLEAIEESGRFLVHVLDADQARLADQMAGRYPIDPFSGQEVGGTTYGPLLVDVAVRAACGFVSRQSMGWSELVAGRIEEISIDPVAQWSPLVHFRSRYVALTPRRPGPQR